VVVLSAALHELPAGSGPSVVVRVSVTFPVVPHVKFVWAEFGALNEPVGADHAYVMPLAFGAVAAPETAIELPTVVSDGLAVTEFIVAQLYVVAVTLTVPACPGAVLHWRGTATLVVVRAVMLNVAEPTHVTLPLVDAPVSAML
jgi:hypothetical protein